MLASIQNMSAVNFLIKMLSVIGQGCTINISENENKRKNENYWLPLKNNVDNNDNYL